MCPACTATASSRAALTAPQLTATLGYGTRTRPLRRRRRGCGSRTRPLRRGRRRRRTWAFSTRRCSSVHRRRRRRRLLRGGALTTRPTPRRCPTPLGGPTCSTATSGLANSADGLRRGGSGPPPRSTCSSPRARSPAPTRRRPTAARSRRASRRSAPRTATTAAHPASAGRWSRSQTADIRSMIRAAAASARRATATSSLSACPATAAGASSRTGSTRAAHSTWRARSSLRGGRPPSSRTRTAARATARTSTAICSTTARSRAAGRRPGLRVPCVLAIPFSMRCALLSESTLLARLPTPRCPTVSHSHGFGLSPVPEILHAGLCCLSVFVLSLCVPGGLLAGVWRHK
mmetsp:Transcript_37136/g.116763  ORF Transcript_37136/g.116763 Transcript_37136/m.116763 type:complete len:347 (+) Transcript_37136:308-1348(+)